MYAQCTDRPKVMNSATMLRRREQYMGSRSGFSPAQRCHLGCFQYLPNRPSRIIDRMQSRVYIGNFSAEGNVFVGELQVSALHSTLQCLSTCTIHVCRVYFVPRGIIKMGCLGM